MQGSAGLEEDGTLMARPWNPRDVPVRNGPGSGRFFVPSTSLDEHSNGGEGGVGGIWELPGARLRRLHIMTHEI